MQTNKQTHSYKQSIIYVLLFLTTHSPPLYLKKKTLTHIFRTHYETIVFHELENILKEMFLNPYFLQSLTKVSIQHKIYRTEEIQV